MGSPLIGNDGDIYVSATPSLVLTDEACDDAGDYTVYTLHTHTYLDPQTPLVLQTSADGATGWTTVTSGYTVAYPIGKITFASARTPGVNANIRAHSGKYFNVSQLAECSSWSLSFKIAMAKTTPFQWGAERNTPTLKAGTAKISSYFADDTLMKEIGNLLLFQFFVDKSANIRWQFYGHVSQDDPKAAVAGMVEQDVVIELSGDPYFLTA